jgi:hypothetical protein
MQGIDEQAVLGRSTDSVKPLCLPGFFGGAWSRDRPHPHIRATQNTYRRRPLGGTRRCVPGRRRTVEAPRSIMRPQHPALAPETRPEHPGARARETRIPPLACTDEVFGKGSADRNTSPSTGSLQPASAAPTPGPTTARGPGTASTPAPARAQATPAHTRPRRIHQRVPIRRLICSDDFPSPTAWRRASPCARLSRNPLPAKRFGRTSRGAGVDQRSCCLQLFSPELQRRRPDGRGACGSGLRGRGRSASSFNYLARRSF